MERYLYMRNLPPGPVMTAGGDTGTTVPCSDTPPRRRVPLCLNADEELVVSLYCWDWAFVTFLPNQPSRASSAGGHQKPLDEDAPDSHVDEPPDSRRERSRQRRANSVRASCAMSKTGVWLPVSLQVLYSGPPAHTPSPLFHFSLADTVTNPGIVRDDRKLCIQRLMCIYWRLTSWNWG